MFKRLLLLSAVASVLVIGSEEVNAEETIDLHTEISKEYNDLVSKLSDSDFAEAGEYVDNLIMEQSLSLEEQDQLVMEYLINNKAENDESINVEPSFGIRSAGLPPTAYGGLNAKEVALAKKSPREATHFYLSSQVAINYTKQKFGRNGYQDNSDAFRHTLWNALLTVRIGAARCATWTNAHEFYASGIDKQMDIKNNTVGRLIGNDHGPNTGAPSGGKVQNIVNAAYNAVKTGRCVVIKSNKIVRSSI